MRVGLATLQRGRRLHLARQAAGVAAQPLAPERYVVVSMDAADPPRPPGATVERLPVADGEPLPLAAARNRAITALGDVDLAILLDVDCIPSPGLVARYAEGASATDALLTGPVGRLGWLPADRVVPNPAELAEARANATPKPVPADDAIVVEPRHELFWSLSFAVRPSVHARIGGFDEAYVGYGAEDTDYAFRAREAGVDVVRVGGAWAHHQHHPVSSPPVEHVEDIVRNATTFHRRWGRWPMEGWLSAFAERGLVRWDPDAPELVLA